MNIKTSEVREIFNEADLLQSTLLLCKVPQHLDEVVW